MTVMTSLSPVTLMVLHLLSLALLLVVTHNVIVHLPPSRPRSTALLLIAFVYPALAHVFPHPSLPVRLLGVTIPWLSAMRTAELARDDALCRSVVQGGWKGFVAWSWIFVDRTDTRIVGAGKRFWVRMFRASFKIVLFAAMRTLFSHYHTVTSVRIWWDGTPWYSPKLYLASLGMGLAFYIWMGGVADLLIGISEPVLGIRMRDMFDSPFLASSVRGFWARRWNGMYQEALANVFAGKRLPTDTKKTDDETVCAPDAGVPAPMTFPTGPREPTSFLRALAVFVLSGIFHDHINLITFHVRSLNTTLFFVIQCLLCFAEMRLSRTAWYKRTGKWVRWAACLTVLGIAAPLFVGCYIRAGAVLALPFF